MIKEEFTVFDIETNGLIENATKIHCLSYSTFNETGFTEPKSITKLEEIKTFILSKKILIGHNIICYDIPVLEKLLNIKIEPDLIIDTLAIAYYLEPERKRRGLEDYGIQFGVKKPNIDDWENLTSEEYCFRCEEDVKINFRLFTHQYNYLLNLYNKNKKEIKRLIEYLSFKMSCLKIQEEIKIDLDLNLCNKTLEELRQVEGEKIVQLVGIMPKSLGKIIKKKPKILYKNNGELSKNGENWFKYLSDNNLPIDTELVREDPNPGSTQQLKEFLFNLGWKPITFKDNDKKEKVPQISLPFGGGICPSVKELYEKEPELEALENLYMIQHRIGLLQSFLDNKTKDNKVISKAHGFTNTLRLQHSKPVVNLPKAQDNISYGKEIRGCLYVKNEEYEFCGSDISGLEDNTKQHYIYFHDPQYVIDMRVPGFDPHIDIATLAGMITKEEAEIFKILDGKKERNSEENEILKDLKNRRGKAKSVNFAATYNAFPKKLQELLKGTLEEAQEIFDVYWKRNWAVKKTAEQTKVKSIGRQKWLLNPISGFWMYLKHEKDRFSTLNQSSGVYVFDTWVRNIYKLKKEYELDNFWIVLQYHDEILCLYKKKDRELIKKILIDAMKLTNDQLKLNVEIGISMDFGQSYADCH